MPPQPARGTVFRVNVQLMLKSYAYCVNMTSHDRAYGRTRRINSILGEFVTKFFIGAMLLTQPSHNPGLPISRLKVVLAIYFT